MTFWRKSQRAVTTSQQFRRRPRFNATADSPTRLETPTDLSLRLVLQNRAVTTLVVSFQIHSINELRLVDKEKEVEVLLLGSI